MTPKALPLHDRSQKKCVVQGSSLTLIITKARQNGSIEPSATWKHGATLLIVFPVSHPVRIFALGSDSHHGFTDTAPTLPVLAG
jgi:hypothetical protein